MVFSHVPLLLASSFLATTRGTASVGLYAFGVGAGIVLLLCLIRLIRFLLLIKGIETQANSEDESAVKASLDAAVPSQVPAHLPARTKIIHLSAGTGATSASEMTQQQKIAAALAKAGMTNSWEIAGASTESNNPESMDSGQASSKQ